MQSLRQLGAGFLLGAICLAIVLGIFSVAMAETHKSASPVPPTTLPPTKAESVIVPVLTSTNTPEASPIPTETFTALPPSTTCPPPAGWVPVTIQAYDTVGSLALQYQVTVDVLKQANCLFNDELLPGAILYVPANKTATPIPCRPRIDWINYIVQPGDTLYRISILYRVDIAAIQQGNCMGSGIFIKAGQIIKVPNVFTSTPIASPTFTATATLTATITNTVGPTATTVTTQPSATTAAPSSTNTATPTATPSGTTVPSITPGPSDTPIPTNTATPGTSPTP